MAQCIGQLLDGGIELVFTHRLADQAQTTGTAGSKDFGGHKVTFSNALAHSFDNVGADGSRDQAYFRFA